MGRHSGVEYGRARHGSWVAETITVDRDGVDRLVVRPARVGDGSELVRLWLDEAEHLVELDPDRFRVPDTHGLAEQFDQRLAEERADVAHFVAEHDGRLVGSVLVRLIEPMPNKNRQIIRELAETRAEVPSLGVESTFRRRGIGRRLMAEAEGWAGERGATKVTLSTYARSPLSNPFYQSLGYTRVSVVYERRI